MTKSKDKAGSKFSDANTWKQDTGCTKIDSESV
jgi:hypothetical protein